jgi:hypothetical protein
VRLHESMLFDPITERTNFCARKLTSFDALEQLNIPNERVASCVRARASPAAATSSASSQLAGRSTPFSRTSGSVNRPRSLRKPITSLQSVGPFDNGIRVLSQKVRRPRRVRQASRLSAYEPYAARRASDVRPCAQQETTNRGPRAARRPPPVRRSGACERLLPLQKEAGRRAPTPPLSAGDRVDPPSRASLASRDARSSAKLPANRHLPAVGDGRFCWRRVHVPRMCSAFASAAPSAPDDVRSSRH